MKHVILIISLFISVTVQAQMWNGQDSLFGNEWINYDRPYFKIGVTRDGIHRISHSTLQQAGIPVDGIPVNQYRLFHLGEEIPLYLSSATILEANDHIEFIGKKNRSELDRHLFEDPDNQLLNPYYSLFNDTAAYFLTWIDDGSTPERIEEIENELTNLPPKEESYSHVIDKVYVENHLKKYERFSGSSFFYSHFDVAEGFASLSSNDLLDTNSSNFSQNIEFNPDHFIDNGGEGVVCIRYACGVEEHHQVISINGTTYDSQEFNGFGIKDVEFEIPLSLIVGQSELVVTIAGQLPEKKERQALVYASLTYPRGFQANDLPWFRFSLSQASTRKYVEIENFNTASGIPVLYDLTNGLRIRGTVENDLVKLALPPSTQDRKFLLVNEEGGISEVASLKPINFINYQEVNAEFIVLSHSLLYNDGNGINWVQEYANYRQSIEGGNYRTLVVDVQQLYDQFGYGVNRHSLSIRNFAHYIIQEWDDPRYFFIIGKGREYPNVRRPWEVNANLGNNFFVPTFSSPASDNLLTARKGRALPLIPTGRIAATSPNDIRIYLDKVKAHEENADKPQTIADKAWMKRALHLGGGSSESEQSSIKNNLNQMASTFKRSLYGGEVKSFFKTSSDPIQFSQSEQIFDRINTGVSLITFFGHASANGFDFNIDNPDNYENYGRYPLILSLGCFSGNIFTSSKGIGERFCFLEDKGALAFGASIGLGAISALKSFADRYYELLGGEEYGQGLGDALQGTLATYTQANYGLFMNTLTEQFTLHGDPAIRMNSRPGPDYVVDYNSVRFKPEVISAQQDSFEVLFDIINLGNNTRDSIAVAFSQQLPDGNVEELGTVKIFSPSFSENFAFRVPIVGKEAVGLNTFHIELDSEMEVEEKPEPDAELNNELVNKGGQKGIPLFIFDNAANPIAPPDFGIATGGDIVLKASTTDAFAPERKYLIEIDTTELFNSPSLQRYEQRRAGGVISWEPDLTWKNEQVYYWRISPDSVSAEAGYAWNYSSFVYLDQSSNGWNQSHYYQYQKNTFENLNLSEQSRKLDFIDNFRDIRIRCKIKSSVDPPFYITNGQGWNSMWAWTIKEGVQVAVIDSASTIHQKNYPPGEFGSINNTGNWIKAFPFKTDNFENRQKLINFLENEIPDGHYVVVYTAQKR